MSKVIVIVVKYRYQVHRRLELARKFDCPYDFLQFLKINIQFRRLSTAFFTFHSRPRYSGRINLLVAYIPGRKVLYLVRIVSTVIIVQIYTINILRKYFRLFLPETVCTT